MHMHEIRLPIPDQRNESSLEREIRIAAELQRQHLGLNHIGQRVPGLTDQQVVDAAGSECVDQIAGLAGAAVEMAAGFDVQDLHMKIITEPGRVPGSWQELFPVANYLPGEIEFDDLDVLDIRRYSDHTNQRRFAKAFETGFFPDLLDAGDRFLERYFR